MKKVEFNEQYEMLMDYRKRNPKEYGIIRISERVDWLNDLVKRYGIDSEQVQSSLSGVLYFIRSRMKMYGITERELKNRVKLKFIKL